MGESKRKVRQTVESMLSLYLFCFVWLVLAAEKGICCVTDSTKMETFYHTGNLLKVKNSKLLQAFPETNQIL